MGKRWCSTCRLRPPVKRATKGESGAKSHAFAICCEAQDRGAFEGPSIVASSKWATCVTAIKTKEPEQAGIKTHINAVSGE